MINKNDTQNKIFLATYGWPMVTLARDDFDAVKKVKCL